MVGDGGLARFMEILSIVQSGRRPMFHSSATAVGLELGLDSVSAAGVR